MLCAARPQVMREQLAGLAGVEERYLRCVDENRRLYNTVQDLRGAIRVFCRIRPRGATGDPSPSCIEVGLEGDLAVYDVARGGGERKQFRVDRVFDEETPQQEVYPDVQPLIRSVLDGEGQAVHSSGTRTHACDSTCCCGLGGRHGDRR